ICRIPTNEFWVGCGENLLFSAFFCDFSCIFEKKAVNLHREYANKAKLTYTKIKEYDFRQA
ncbi:MAG: hypothetical protein J6T19_00520, partial [Paludibacteraceae bacterium]|nr:hypothetical protein [Paludibacteraceae bacterium]